MYLVLFLRVVCIVEKPVGQRDTSSASIMHPVIDQNVVFSISMSQDVKISKVFYSVSLAIIHRGYKDKYIVLHPHQVRRSPATADLVYNDCGFSTPDYAFA